MSSSVEPSSSDTAIPSNRYKTELCRSFEELGVCRYGDKCQYAHGSAELRSLDRHPRHKTELCRSFHTTGLCSYGYRCHFIHNEAQNLVTSLDEVQRGRKTLMTSLSEEERVNRTLMTSLGDVERGRRTLMTSLNDVERGRRKIRERILGLIARNVLHQQLLHAISGVALEVQNRVQSSPTDPDAYGRFIVSPTSLIKHQPEAITIPDVQRTHIGVDGLRQSSRRLDYSSSPDSPSFLGTSLSSVSSGGTSQTWSSIDDSIPSPTWSSFEESCATTSFKYNSPPPSISPREVDSFTTADELTTKYRFY